MVVSRLHGGWARDGLHIARLHIRHNWKPLVVLTGISVATMAERSKTLDSGSREPGSIPVSGLLVGFFRTAHAEKYTHGQ